MSVYLWQNRELVGLYLKLVEDADQTTLREAMQSLHLANRAALVMSYGDEAEREILDAERFDLDVFPQDGGQPPVADWTVTQWARNLLYNCVSQSGRDFAPQQDKELVLGLAEAIDARELRRARATVRVELPPVRHTGKGIVRDVVDALTPQDQPKRRGGRVRQPSPQRCAWCSCPVNPLSAEVGFMPDDRLWHTSCWELHGDPAILRANHS